MDYIFYQVAAINGFDAVGHYLRAGLIVNQCATYAQSSRSRAARRSSRRERRLLGVDGQDASAIDAAGDDPVLRATAIALARALGQEVEKAKKEVAAEKQGAPSSPSAKAKSKRAPSDKPREDTPRRRSRVPTVAPRAADAAPRPTADAAPRRRAEARRADRHAPRPPTTPTPTPDARPVRRAARLPLRQGGGG